MQICRCEGVKIQICRCEGVKIQICRCEGVKIQICRCEGVKIQICRCEGVKMQICRCEGVKMQISRCEGVKMQYNGRFFTKNPSQALSGIKWKNTCPLGRRITPMSCVKKKHPQQNRYINPNSCAKKTSAKLAAKSRVICAQYTCQQNASGNNKISVHHANEQQLANSSRLHHTTISSNLKSQTWHAYTVHSYNTYHIIRLPHTVCILDSMFSKLEMNLLVQMLVPQ